MTCLAIRKYQKMFLLEPGKMIKFFSNVVSPNTMIMNYAKFIFMYIYHENMFHESPTNKDRIGSHFFLKSSCTLDGLKLKLF